jgi:hypothetical protein
VPKGAMRCQRETEVEGELSSDGDELRGCLGRRGRNRSQGCGYARRRLLQLQGLRASGCERWCGAWCS